MSLSYPTFPADNQTLIHISIPASPIVIYLVIAMNIKIAKIMIP
jgi:hypothetical protein